MTGGKIPACPFVSMQPGTKTLLVGTHQVFIHPLMVAWCWRKLYGHVPRDPRLWLAFVVHDWGYWRTPNIDGPEGDLHPEWGAALMERWFGKEWGDFCRGHSRFYAQQCGLPLSRLCAADKLASASWWPWLFVVLATLSGEIDEYMKLTQRGNGETKYTLYEPEYTQGSKLSWYREVAAFLREWAYHWVTTGCS